MGTFVEEITINAPTEAVWNALADIGSIYKWNPGVKQSHMTTSSEVGLGSGRHCDLGGKNYLDETVIEWKPEVALTMRIVAQICLLKQQTSSLPWTAMGTDVSHRRA